MALLADYIKNLEAQKKLISDLGDSGPPLPGLDVNKIADRLASLDENLQKTVDYYNSQAEAEADKEEQEAEKAGKKETAEQKKARRKKKRDEAAKKIKDTKDRFIKTQKDFIQEQISVIKVNWGVIDGETKDLPQTITLATATSLQPAAVGAAVPNPIYNLGVYYQVLKAIGRSLNVIKTAFLNMLIAADKIKFALPIEVIKTLETILTIQKALVGSLPDTSSIDQPAPNVPDGTELTLKKEQFANGVNGKNGRNITVTSEDAQARKGQTGQIVQDLGNGSFKIKIGPIVP
jgi:hypothetical protein